MVQSAKTLLFATDLSENCQAALESSISIASESHGTLFLLYVLNREIPGHVEEHLRTVMGEEKWSAMIREYEQEARNALIGKMTTGKMGQKAMRMYCTEAGIDQGRVDFQYRELVVAGSNIPGTIVSQAIENDCELIVLGAQRGIMANNSIGSVVKGVLRKSRIPVMVVPPHLKSRSGA